MVKVRIIEPNITREESDKQFERIKEVLEEIALNVVKRRKNGEKIDL